MSIISIEYYLDTDLINTLKNEALTALKNKDISLAQKKFIKAFFGNIYVENLYYKMVNATLNKRDIKLFYDASYMRNRTVILYLIEIFPESYFWKEMRKLIYISKGHY